MQTNISFHKNGNKYIFGQINSVSVLKLLSIHSYSFTTGLQCLLRIGVIKIKLVCLLIQDKATYADPRGTVSQSNQMITLFKF